MNRLLVVMAVVAALAGCAKSDDEKTAEMAEVLRDGAPELACSFLADITGEPPEDDPGARGAEADYLETLAGISADPEAKEAVLRAADDVRAGEYDGDGITALRRRC